MEKSLPQIEGPEKELFQEREEVLNRSLMEEPEELIVPNDLQEFDLIDISDTTRQDRTTGSNIKYEPNEKQFPEIEIIDQFITQNNVNQNSKQMGKPSNGRPVFRLDLRQELDITEYYLNQISEKATQNKSKNKKKLSKGKKKSKSTPNLDSSTSQTPTDTLLSDLRSNDEQMIRQMMTRLNNSNNQSDKRQSDVDESPLLRTLLIKQRMSEEEKRRHTDRQIAVDKSPEISEDLSEGEQHVRDLRSQITQRQNEKREQKRIKDRERTLLIEQKMAEEEKRRENDKQTVVDKSPEISEDLSEGEQHVRDLRSQITQRQNEKREQKRIKDRERTLLIEQKMAEEEKRRENDKQTVVDKRPEISDNCSEGEQQVRDLRSEMAERQKKNLEKIRIQNRERTRKHRLRMSAEEKQRRNEQRRLYAAEKRRLMSAEEKQIINEQKRIQRAERREEINEQDRNRRQMKLNRMSEQERRLFNERRKIMFELNHGKRERIYVKGSINYPHLWQSWSEEKKLEIRRKMSESKKRYWDQMTPEQRVVRCQHVHLYWRNRDKQSFSRSLRNGWNNKTAEEKQKIVEKIKQTKRLNKISITPEERERRKQKIGDKMRQMWANRTPEHRQRVIQMQREGRLKKKIEKQNQLIETESNQS